MMDAQNKRFPFTATLPTGDGYQNSEKCRQVIQLQEQAEDRSLTG